MFRSPFCPAGFTVADPRGVMAAAATGLRFAATGRARDDVSALHVRPGACRGIGERSHSPLPRIRRFRRAVAALCIGCLIPACNTASAVTLLTEENPPFSQREDERLRGLAVEVVEEAARRAGLPPTVEMLTWDRGWRRVRTESDTCLFPVARLPERAALFTWIGPIATNAWGLFARRDFAGGVRTLAQARGYRVGVADDPARLDFLRANGVTDVRPAESDRDNAVRLFLVPADPAHVDLWLAGVYGARAAAGDARAADLRLLLIGREIPLYLACNRNTPVATVRALGDALSTMDRDGTRARISARYDPRWSR